MVDSKVAGVIETDSRQTIDGIEFIYTIRVFGRDEMRLADRAKQKARLATRRNVVSLPGQIENLQVENINKETHGRISATFTVQTEVQPGYTLGQF